MFESISSKIEKALHTLRGKGRITDINISETVKEVRKALLDADVSYPIAKEFTDKVKAEAMGRNVIQSIEPGGRRHQRQRQPCHHPHRRSARLW